MIATVNRSYGYLTRQPQPKKQVHEHCGRPVDQCECFKVQVR